MEQMSDIMIAIEKIGALKDKLYNQAEKNLMVNTVDKQQLAISQINLWLALGEKKHELMKKMMQRQAMDSSVV